MGSGLFNLCETYHHRGVDGIFLTGLNNSPVDLQPSYITTGIIDLPSLHPSLGVELGRKCPTASTDRYSFGLCTFSFEWGTY